MTQPTNRAGFAERRIRKMLAGTAVEINGPNPWDPQINHPGFYKRVLTGGSLALGESYMDAWWECAQLDEMLNKLLRSPRIRKMKFASQLTPFVMALVANLQSKTRAYQVGEAHYDISNELYRAMLDARMVYTCGYWRDAGNLDDAQEHKLELVCRKLNLQPGMRVLDIGCGWGSFAKYAAEKYGVEVVGVTVSREQVELGNELCAGLPVTLRLQDYRAVDERFDAIVSLGMFEHVGHKNYRTYFRMAQRCLAERGRFLLQTIGKTAAYAGVDPWIAKYIFPNGEIPSLKRIAAALESPLVIEDVHNFGPDYDKTLMAWFANFDRAWPRLRASFADRPQRFYRMWKYYLHVCAGAFRARDLQLWQIVITNSPGEGAYRRPDM